MPLTKEEEALSAEYFKDAAELLEKTYRRFYSGKRETLFAEDLDVLWNNVQPMNGYEFLLSCKKHISDFTGDDRNAGDWFPTPANLKKHAVSVEAERVAEHQRMRAEEAEARGQKVSLGKNFTTVAIEDPYLQAMMGKKFVECLSGDSARCQFCYDSGYVRFYYYPEKKTHIFLGKEWLDLWDRNKKQAEEFRMALAICDECEAAKDVLYKENEKEERFRLPMLFHIRKLVARRKNKHKEILRRKDLAAGDRTQLIGASYD
tara:strand:+ start:287 stop:1069 length:783 start_codon:yes stop_codon:yes gene_type:complete